jgi:hypothetical protein
LSSMILSMLRWDITPPQARALPCSAVNNTCGDSRRPGRQTCGNIPYPTAPWPWQWSWGCFRLDMLCFGAHNDSCGCEKRTPVS